jgi:hypothetical protein
VRYTGGIKMSGQGVMFVHMRLQERQGNKDATRHRLEQLIRTNERLDRQKVDGNKKRGAQAEEN